MKNKINQVSSKVKVDDLVRVQPYIDMVDDLVRVWVWCQVYDKVRIHIVNQVWDQINSHVYLEMNNEKED